MNPESGTVSYTYDSDGNLATRTDARGIVTTYTYDTLNRVTQRAYATPSPTPLNYSTTPTVTYYYDTLTNAKGRLIKVESSVSTTEYSSFDILGRVTASKQTTNGVTYGDGTVTSAMTYSYNLSGALIEKQYPSGQKVKNTIDSNGDLAMVQSRKSSSSGYWSYANSFSYNAAGAVTSMQLGNGRWESTTFSERLQPVQIALGTTSGAANLLDLDYTYGTTANNGNILTQTITVPTVGANTGFTAVQTYNYDAVNRLKDATEMITPHGGSETQSWKQVFSFDRFGNRNFVTGSGQTTTLGSCPTAVCNPSIDPSNNRLTASTYGYNFDSAGNTTRDASDRKFTYDGENKQTKVESLTTGTNTVTGTVGEYFYDGDGKRVKKYVPSTGETTVFVYDAAGKLIEEYSTIVATTNDAKVAYLTNDHLGSPRINTDANGNVTTRHDYHPFGEEIATSQRTTGLAFSSDTVRKQFTGYEKDRETDLDFAQARYLNAGFGRFSSPDHFGNDSSTTDPQRWNLFVYVRNNPLRFVDPTGKDLAINYQGSTYQVRRSGQSLQIVDSVGNAAEAKELVAAAKMLNDLDQRGGLNNEINTLIDSGSHVMDLGFVSGSDNPVGGTGPSESDPEYSRSGVTLNDSSEAMVSESTIVLGTEIQSAAYLARKNDLNAAHAYGRVVEKDKVKQVDQFNNDPGSPLPGSTTYEEYRAQASSDLRRTMGIAPQRAMLPAKSQPKGRGAGEIDNPEPDLGPAPPPPARRPQPSENNTPVQRSVRRP